VFEDPDHDITDVTEPDYSEERFRAIGMLKDGRLVTVLYTHRSHKRRIISAWKITKMSEETMIQARRLANGKLVEVMPDGTERKFVRQTDWAAFDAQTDEEVMTAVLSDPDAIVRTDEDRKDRHVPNVRKIRQKLQLTQEQFAERFQVPIGTLRDWEQGVTMPDKAARSYLRVIAKIPQAVIEALAA